MNDPKPAAELSDPAPAQALQQQPRFALTPTTLKEALEFAELLSRSSLVPKDFVGNPGNIIVAIQWGAEVGLAPLQAMQNIAVINGRPCLWGDAVLALVRASGLLDAIKEEVTDAGATCTVKRRGSVPISRTFTVEDAKRAGLWGKQGPWQTYPKRMLQMRARAFALRDEFTDVLKGMHVAEEISDLEIDITPGAQGLASLPPAVVTYPQADFEKNLPAWRTLIDGGKKTADEIIAVASTKAPLTDAQMAALRSKAEMAPTGAQA
jgi:hypothetical protein